jgi:glycosyltransferase involved in cell wall biosynthesis
VKVLHVVIDGELAGGQYVARALVEGLRARGHEGVIVSPTRGAFTDAAAATGIPVRIADVRRVYRLDGLLALWRVVRAERVDVVQSHGMVASNVLVRLAARLAGRPVVSHIHSPNRFREQRVAAAAYRFLDNATSRLCARVVAVSDSVARTLVEQGVPARLVVTIPNGLDPREPPPRPADLPARGRLVACVGRLEPAKGQADLIDALPRLDDEVRVLFVGRDVAGHRAALEARAAALGVADRIVFLGARTDVAEVLAACELLVQPSWLEGFPIAPLEAMAAGLPVVATDVGGTSEIVVDGVTGRVVPPHDPGALAAAIADVLGDRAAAEALGRAGRDRLRERFSVDRMVDAFVAVYEDALR